MRFVGPSLAMALLWPSAGGVKGNVTFYVATDGNDANPGTKERPFASLEAARDAVRKLKRAGPLKQPVTVWIRGGVYPRTKTFQLKQEDSGTKDAPVVYRACEGQKVHLVGGQEIKASWLEPVKEATVLKRLAPGVRANARQVDLKAHGITDYGEMGGHAGGLKLFCNGKRLPLARWPNDGYALARRGKVIGLDPNGEPKLVDEGKTSKTAGFKFTGDPPNRWHSLEGVYLRGYWWEEYCFHAWTPKQVDPESQQITFGHTLRDYLKEWRRFYAANVLEEMDRPGEWYLDRKAGVLYLLPPHDLAQGQLQASMLQDTMVALDNTSYVTIRGLTLEVMRGGAVIVGGGTHNRIAGCIIRNANQGVTVAGGTNNGVVGCDIYDLEATGMRLSGGDRKTLTPAGHYAVNNHIHHYALLHKTWQPGIRIQGVGQRVAHNRIHHAPQYAISYDGNDHLFEFNDMHDLCLEMSDVGVIGCGTNWTYRGNVIRHNFIHHIPKRPYPGVVGVYLDNCACSADVIGNVFYKMTKPVMIGGGRDNIVRNNIFIECAIPVYMDNRGLRWETRWGHFRPGGPMYKPLKEFKHDQPPWSTRYPKLARILDDMPQAPLGNIVERNVSVRSGWSDIEAVCRKTFSTHVNRGYLKMGDNFVTEDDPGFVDADNMNFQLRDDSTVYRAIPGFKKIRFERIGLYKDEHRATWPVPRGRP